MYLGGMGKVQTKRMNGKNGNKMKTNGNKMNHIQL
jgi:hypothetical protein